MKKLGINIIIERERVGEKIIFIASSPDINVFAEGKSIDEAKLKFLEGARTHLKNFPEDKEMLRIKTCEETYEMPLVTKAFL
ncbi:MAG: hypothetical protein ISS82_00715 [Nanoarchaeota archaeon]|nr:hypothetical protein [Nanoarchaeota archaeon]